MANTKSGVCWLLPLFNVSRFQNAKKNHGKLPVFPPSVSPIHSLILKNLLPLNPACCTIVSNRFLRPDNTDPVNYARDHLADRKKIRGLCHCLHLPRRLCSPILRTVNREYPSQILILNTLPKVHAKALRNQLKA